MEKMLTETELELMNIVWELGEGTVREIMDLLPRDRMLAYTSVSTIMRILEKKKEVKTRKSGKTHIYTPLVTRGFYQSKGVSHLVENVFLGVPKELVKNLIDSEDLTREDLAELKKIINGKLK